MKLSYLNSSSRLLATLVLIFCHHFGYAQVLQSVLTESSKENFQTILTFDQDLGKINPTIEYIKQTIQVDIPKAYLKKGKDLRRVKSSDVKSVFTYQAQPDVLRSRIILQATKQAADFEGLVTTEVQGRNLVVSVYKSEAFVSKNVANEKMTELPMVPPSALSSNDVDSVLIDESPPENPVDIVKKEMKLPEKVNVASEDQALAPSQPSAKTITENTNVSSLTGSHMAASNLSKEEAIPLFQGKENKAKSPSSSWVRVLISMGILSLVGLGFLWFAKWWGKRNPRNDLDAKIRVMTQHHLGPKKSLMIVRVAGEHLLLGVTDQSINIVKTLSLIDDEVPNETPQHFGAALRDAGRDDLLIHHNQESGTLSLSSGNYKDEAKDDTNDDFSFGNIRDRVSERLKQLKEI